MTTSTRWLHPAAAARHLGVSAKTLRIYEVHGLLAPARNPAGWRSYGPDALARGAEIVALRALGLSLAQVARVLQGDADGLAPALAAHQTALESRALQLAATIETVQRLRADIARGQAPTLMDLTQLAHSAKTPRAAFTLPWPWGGERFVLDDIRPLNYLIGPLGSGKTRLAMHLAEVLPGAEFHGLERVTDGRSATALRADPGLRRRVERAQAALLQAGATASDALLALLTAMESEGPGVLVIDMVEEGLDAASQRSVRNYLRRRTHASRPLFTLTRSSAILDLAAVGDHEAIYLCPANHGVPTRVFPYAGTPGYESVASCLATPEVRARTQGVVAWRPPQMA